MSPLELIESGILENDFEKVIQGYNALTGKNIQSGEQQVSGDTGEPNEVQQQMPVQKGTVDDFTMAPRKTAAGKYGRKESIQVGQNTFVDDGSEAKGEEFNTPDVPLTTRRPPVKMVEVTCSACGQKEMVNPAYKTGAYHRCGRCVG